MKIQKQNSLISFIKKECANWDNYYNVCLLSHETSPTTDRPCCVMQGERCGYFEKAVLGPPDYKYRLPGYDYTKLFVQYTEQTKAKTVKVEQRFCQCGRPLRFRQRYCESCKKNRAKEANRKRQRKFRFSNSSNVTL